MKDRTNIRIGVIFVCLFFGVFLGLMVNKWFSELIALSLFFPMLIPDGHNKKKQKSK